MRYTSYFLRFLSSCMLAYILATPTSVAKPFNKPDVKPNAINQYYFIQNKGQWTTSILFKANINEGAIFLEKNRLVFHLVDNSLMRKLHDHKAVDTSEYHVKHHSYSLTFKDANITSVTNGEKPSPHYYNYFIGNDKKKWASNVYGFEKININEIYKGVDLDIYAIGKQLKYDFVLQPKANPAQIKIQYAAVDKLYLENNQLVVKTSLGIVRERQPLAYQIIGSKKKIVACNYKLDNNEVSFVFPNGYDANYQLIIDPELIFSTYSGSKADNFGYTATYDKEGYLYSGSTVFDIGYPTTLGAYSEVYKFSMSGNNKTNTADYAITKYDTTGTFLIYSTYIGGTLDEAPHSIICNENDELLVFGTTGSLDYPLVNPVQAQFGGGSQVIYPGTSMYFRFGTDMYITRLNKEGTALLSSTYFGGSGNDGLNSLSTDIYTGIVNGNLRNINIYSPLTYNYADEFRGEIDIDALGNVYIASCTYSTDFPVTSNAFQQFNSGTLDGCIVKFDANMSQVLWSSYLGGQNSDALYSIDFDSLNQVYVAGGTDSRDLITQPNVIQPTYGGGRADGYLAKISADGQQILASTYWGNGSYNQIYFIDLDRKGYVFVYGQSENAADFFIRNKPIDPTKSFYSIPNSGQFITKFENNLNSTVWSTSFGTPGGLPNLSPTAFRVDVCSKIYLSGWGGESNENLYVVDFVTNTVIKQNNASTTSGLETTADAYQKNTDGSDFYLLILEDDASKLFYATFFGGNISHEHVDGGTSRFDRKGKIYQSVCAGCGGNDDFPIKPNPGAWSTTNNSRNCNNGVFRFNFDLPIVISDFKFTKCNPIEFTNLSLTQKATNFEWRFGDGTSSTDKSPTHQYKKSGTYKVKLIVRDNLTCNLVDSVSKTIYISKLADGVSASANPNLILEGGKSTLIASPNTGFKYEWFPEDKVDNNKLPTTSTKKLKDTTDFEVEFTDPINGCKERVKVRVDVIEVICKEPFIYVPNAFTPNNDNANETLKVLGEQIATINFSIYNRWGEKVFATQDKNKGWDGTFRGKALDPDVYVYYLEGTCIDDENFLLKGNITLIK